jgi:hypothetical protein
MKNFVVRRRHEARTADVPSAGPDLTRIVGLARRTARPDRRRLDGRGRREPDDPPALPRGARPHTGTAHSLVVYAAPGDEGRIVFSGGRRIGG